ncbi:MAG: MFS transporter, partial [bacterium]|nr:MFS transporter [bacterium]
LFTATSLFYFGSFLFIFLIRVQEPRVAVQEDHSGWKDIRQGLSYAAKHPILLPLFILTVADNLLIMGPATVGTPIFVKQELQGSATAYATTEVSYAVGMLTGTGLMLYFGKRFKRGKLLLWGMFFDGVTFIPIYFIDSLLALQITFVVHSIAIPFLIVPRAAIIQTIVPENMTGRIFALINLAVVGVTAISAGVTGIAVESFGVRVVFAAIGIGGGICGVIGLWFARQLRETA